MSTPLIVGLVIGFMLGVYAGVMFCLYLAHKG